MTTYIDSRIVTLTSATAKNKYNSTALSDVEFEMIGLLKQESDIIFTEVSVLSAEIPVSFYNVTATNNAFRYIFGAINYLITIPVGNYNATTLITYLNTQFIAPVTMTISKLTGKITLTGNGINTIQYLGGTSTTNTIIGFTNTTSSGITLTAPFPMNLLGTKRISICSTYLPIYSYSSVSNTLSDTLATIEVDQPAFGLLLYKNTTQLRSKLRVDTLDVFDIQLRDELNQLLDFNNCDWSITLVLDITRKTIVDTAEPFHTILANNSTLRSNFPKLEQKDLPKDINLPQVDNLPLGKENEINSDLDLLNYNPQ